MDLPLQYHNTPQITALPSSFPEVDKVPSALKESSVDKALDPCFLGG